MRAIVAATLAAVALVAVHLAAGGGDFEVTPPPAPCAERPAIDRSGTLETAERLGLTALDAAACDLGVTRERLLLSLARDRRLPDGVGPEQAVEAFRDGVTAAIDAEREAGRLGETEGLILRQAIMLLPVEELFRRFFGGEGG